MHKVDGHVLPNRSSILEDRKRGALEDQPVSLTKRSSVDKKTAPFPNSSFQAPPKPVKLISLSLEHMGDFDKKCPTFQRPVEIGQMSLDQERRLKPNSSLLKYFCPVNPTTVKMDLSVGFKTYVPKPSRPEEGISPILQWVTTSPEAFLPGAKNRGSQTSQTVPSSPVGAKKKNIISPLAQSEKFSANGSTRATSSSTTTTDSTSEKKTKRPDNLHTNFITWRGMITRIACTPYDHTPWKMAVTKYKGTIYFRELETEEAVRRKASETDKERRMCYWGVKFEDYLTSSTPVASTRAVSSQRGWKEGPANDKEDYCSVVRTKINQHSIVMAGEVDCCEHGARDGGPSSYIELKTSRIIYTDKNKYSFKRFVCGMSCTHTSCEGHLFCSPLVCTVEPSYSGVIRTTKERSNQRFPPIVK